MRNVLKRWRIYLVVVLILSVLLTIGVGGADVLRKNPSAELPQASAYHLSPIPYQSIDILEDPKGQLDIIQVSSPAFSGKFSSTPAPYLNLVRSKSTWWIRLKPPANGLYLTLFNPTVQHLTIFIPRLDKPGSFDRDNQGWGDRPSFQYNTFIYPALQVNTTQEVYVKTSSIYLQNFTIRWFDQSSYYWLKTWTLTIISLLLGFLIALMLNHFIQVMESRDKTQLLYTLRILASLFHFMAFYGVFRLIPHPISNLLVQHLSSAAIFTSVIGTVFATAYLSDTKAEKSMVYIRDITLIVGLLLALYELIFGIDRLHVILTNNLMNLALLVTVIFLFLAIQAKPLLYHYYWGNIIAAIGFILLNILRQNGTLPNNETTLFLLLLTLVLETLIFSAGTARKVASLRNRAEASELSFLRAQIQPHFFYNTITVIAGIAAENGMKARSLLLDLSEYLHQTFNFKSLEHSITLESEIGSIEAYRRICEARYNHPIDLFFDIPANLNMKIPAFVLQPLVENAIRHGVRNIKGSGQVIIQISDLGKKIRFVVEDNGSGMTQKEIDLLLNAKSSIDQNGRTGIYNARERLRHYFKSELQIENREPSGLKCWFEISKKLL